ncbi:condensation domain-containing protein, partial [Streptomyces alkaliphilus]|uniref:condensation domain-containing protein n=1 Tax=Streptomyces alkaliphilus TaxID=1472722 RepID=UPI002B20012B
MAERLLAEIWEELLGVTGVGAGDDFFALGGHSLLATRLTHRLGRALDIRVPLRLVFEHPVLADLAQHLPTEGERPVGIPMIDRLPEADGTLVLPASVGQERLWVLCRLEEEANLTYHIRGAVHIEGALDVEALRTALLRLTHRHEVLRTRLDEVSGEIRQLVSADALVPLSRVATPDWESVIESETRRAFDLTAGPLWHVTLIRAATDHHVFVMVLHHVIADGWSLDLLLRELAEHYATASSTPAVAPPPPAGVQYAEIAHLQRETASSELDFWRSHMAGAPSLDLPTDHPRPARQTYRGDTVPLTLSDDALAAAARGADTTAFTVLATALVIVLAKLTGQYDVTIGTPSAGREHPGTAEVVGYVVDTLPLRVRLSPEGTLKDALHHVRDVVERIRTHQRVPLEELIRELRPPRDHSRTPLFQVLLAINGTPPRYDLPGLRVRPAPIPIRTVPYDLVIQAEERDGRITGHLIFNTDLFEATTAELIAERLSETVSALAGDVDEVVRDVGVLSVGECVRLGGVSVSS